MRAAPCRRICPATGKVLEVLRGRSYQPSRVKFWRRLLAQKLAVAAAALARSGEVAGGVSGGAVVEPPDKGMDAAG
jgi:hypothetical protein